MLESMITPTTSESGGGAYWVGPAIVYPGGATNTEEALTEMMIRVFY